MGYHCFQYQPTSIALGGYLAEINNTDEQNFVQKTQSFLFPLLVSKINKACSPIDHVALPRIGASDMGWVIGNDELF